MIDSRVLLPEPEAPTMATDRCAGRVKSMSWRIVKVPVESWTCLVTRSTAMMGSDMKELLFFGAAPSRRRWLAHCSVLAASAVVAAAMPSWAAVGGRVRKILVVGDSLSAEYGISRGTGWVALLEQRLAREKSDASVVNASISGDTTSGGLARLPALLREHRPDLVIIELGGNDALRGLPLDVARANLTEMARLSSAAGAKVVIVGMQLPPNYGRAYGERFASLFAEVARSEKAALVPFLLKGVADGPRAEAMFQPDRIHPLASAQPAMLDNVWPVLAPLLK
jgi:acyl-CoA thioesterase-1